MIISGLKNITAGQNITLATIPEEYRPAEIARNSCVDTNGNVYKVFILLSGNIVLYAYNTNDSGQMNFENTLCYIVD